jgi:trimeric autotransporter adhesin
MLRVALCALALTAVPAGLAQSGPRNVCNKTPGAPCLQVTLAGDGAGRVTSEPKGISCPSTCVATFLPYQQKINLRAAEASGSAFAGWTGGCLPRNSPTCVVSLSEATFVTARFDK